MPKFFVEDKQIKDSYIVIDNEDSHHIRKVLRKKIGEEIVVCDINKSINYNCKIIEFKEDKTICEIKKEIIEDYEVGVNNIKISILQGLPKADKMELVIQKSVELGVYDIYPVMMDRCIVKIQDKEKSKKIDRWQKISEVAAKQSNRDNIPQINEFVSMKNILQLNKFDIILVAYEKEKENKLRNEITKIKERLLENNEIKIGILIGPEGGISENEIKYMRENNVKIVTLGNRILRTETVALNILSILMYELEN